MAAVISISPPFVMFSDVDGDPLESGYVYVGVNGLNPITNPIAVFADVALTIPIAQPIRTIGGHPVLSGSPTRLYTGASDYSILVRNKNSTLVYSSLSNKTKLGLIDLSTDVTGSLPSTQIDYAVTAAETAAGVVPTNRSYPPGDVRRYGAVLDGVADDTTAFQNALSSHDVLPWQGIGLTTGTLTFPSTGRSILGKGGLSILKYTGVGVAINFNGQTFCKVDSIQLQAPSASIAIHVGAISHWGKVTKCDIRGSATGNPLSGAHNPGTGIQVERSFYVQIEGNDISSFGRGFHGTFECNGNFFVENSIRRCNRGVHMDDTSGNSDGNVIADNEIEGGEVGDLYAIEIQGCSNMMVRNNRLEYSPNGTAHIFVHDGVNDAVRHSLLDNRCLGSIMAVKMGDNAGANRVSTCSLRGGYYANSAAGSITIGVDCDFCEVDLPSTRYIANGATGLLVNASVSTILSILDDQSVTLSLTGCTTVPTGNILVTVNKSVVSFYLPAISGLSNTVAATLTGLSAIYRPKATVTKLWRVLDNSNTIVGLISIDPTTGTITISNSISGAGVMTNGNNKGVFGAPLSYNI